VFVRFGVRRSVPRRPLGFVPIGAFDDVYVFELGLPQRSFHVEVSQALREQRVAAGARFPPRQHDASAWPQDASAVDKCGDGRVGELNGVNAHDGVDRRIVETGGLEISETELGSGGQTGSVRVRHRLGQRDGREIDANEAGSGASSDFDAIATATTPKIDENGVWLAADADRQDPPANLASIPSQQPNARIAVMPAHQHTVGHTGCSPQVIANFIDTATADGLDTSCIEQADVPGLTFTLP
jgi:hypothetical protein